MCSIYAMDGSRHSIGELTRQRVARAMGPPVGPPDAPSVFQLGYDLAAPIIRNGPEGRELAMARWVASASIPSRREMSIERRCVVPFTAFVEHQTGPGGQKIPVWFALNGAHPLACFAGLATGDGFAGGDGFAILSVDRASAEIRAINAPSMPVILTTREEINLWMNLPPREALQLRQPLRDGMLRMVMHAPEAGWQSVH